MPRPISEFGPLPIAVTLLALCSLSACNTPSAVDHNFGMSVRNAQSAQTLHPRADRPPQTAPNVDAGVVRSSIARYEKTYVTPPTPLTSLDQSLGTAANTAPR